MSAPSHAPSECKVYSTSEIRPVPIPTAKHRAARLQLAKAALTWHRAVVTHSSISIFSFKPWVDQQASDAQLQRGTSGKSQYSDSVHVYTEKSCKGVAALRFVTGICGQLQKCINPKPLQVCKGVRLRECNDVLQLHPRK